MQAHLRRYALASDLKNRHLDLHTTCLAMPCAIRTRQILTIPNDSHSDTGWFLQTVRRHLMLSSLQECAALCAAASTARTTQSVRPTNCCALALN